MFGSLVNDLRRVYGGGHVAKLAGLTPYDLFELYTAITSLQFGKTTTINSRLAGIYKKYGFNVANNGVGYIITKP